MINGRKGIKIYCIPHILIHFFEKIEKIDTGTSKTTFIRHNITWTPQPAPRWIDSYARFSLGMRF